LIRKVTDASDELFLKTLLSFHPTREIPSDTNYPILVGPCHGQTTFYVQTSALSENSIPDIDDAISYKKCLNNLLCGYSSELINFSEKKFKASALSKLSAFLVKII
jgi:hypothetical protein